jgi:pimeloyl-ACP methyl ester carboxylesterase
MSRVGVLARGLLLFLAVEVGCYAWLASAVAPTQGWPAALALIGLLALAVRAVPVLVLYAIALATAEPVPPECRLGAGARIGYALGEIGAAAVIYTFLHPFAFLLMPRDRTVDGSGTPVLLVHGYLCNRGVWRSLARWLEARGYRVYTVDLEPVFGDIDVFAEQVAERIDAIAAATGGRVQVVAASMGGLAMRAYLRRHGGARVAKLITLGSPHHGSRHARMALGINGRQMRPGSDWLRRLAEWEAGAPAVPVVSIYSCHDDMVSPVSSSRLPGALNVPLPGVGHLSLALSRRVREALAEHLA